MKTFLVWTGIVLDVALFCAIVFFAVRWKIFGNKVSREARKREAQRRRDNDSYSGR